MELDKALVINQFSNNDASTVQLLLGVSSTAKVFNSTQLSLMSSRHNLYGGLLGDIKTWQNSYNNGVSIGQPDISHNEMMRQMIKIDFDLGGNGLGYQDGTSFFGTDLPDSVFHQYIQYGKESLGSNSLYNVHHLNSVHPNIELATHPDNIVMVQVDSHPHDQDGLTNQPMADNMVRIRSSLSSGNSGLFFLGLLVTAIYGFFFGFFIRFLTIIVHVKIRNKSTISKSILLFASKEGTKSGLIMMGMSLFINLILQFIFVFIFNMTRVHLDEVGIHLISVLLYMAITALGIGIYVLIKKRQFGDFLKKFGMSFLYIIVATLVGIPTLFLSGPWKILGMLATIILLVGSSLFWKSETTIDKSNSSVM